jgi:hypothetical protein
VRPLESGRNGLCYFQGELWIDLRLLLLRIAAMLQTWVILCPQVKKKGVLMETAEAEKHCFRADVDYCMNQVKNEKDYFMFKQAFNQQDQPLPEEVTMKLSGYLKHDADVN